LGGFSQAFVDAGWEVITIDVDPKFAPVIVADVRTLLDDSEFMSLKPEVILTSPPCTRLSRADDWPLPGIYEGLSVAGACLEIVARMRPKYWGLENPQESMIRWFIGAPTKRLRLNSFGYRTVKRTGLWGNIPLGLINDSPKVNPKGVRWENGPRAPHIRAMMPYAFSKAILNAVSESEGGST
jgi:hypothetical protein